jgi:glyoxylase-like metal-dependent hydrolase (beta-lactamase superfamily II)
VSEPQLKVATVVSYPFEENTYIAHLAGRKDCLVFDPGLEPDKIFEVLDRDGLEPAALMITHGHGDHIGGIADLKDRWPDCPIVIGTNEANKLTDARLNLTAQFGMPVVAPPADVLLNEGDVYEAAGMKLEVREIPGHSTGHVVYVFKDLQPYTVFGGDVLFAGSVGRCDLPQGSFAKLAEGIQKKLFTLPDDTVVLSGHGPPTTTGREKIYNPFVGRASGEG